MEAELAKNLIFFIGSTCVSIGFIILCVYLVKEDRKNGNGR